MEAAGEAPANKGKKKAAKARLDKSDEEAINAAKAAAFINQNLKSGQNTVGNSVTQIEKRRLFC